MGIHSRDYLRESQGGSGLGGSGTPVVVRLIVATIVVFVLQLLIPSLGGPTGVEFGGGRGSFVQDWLEFDPDAALFGGQIWRFVTYAFCHDRFGIWHIVFNMLFLWWFGRQLESMYGSREFLLFYLTSAVAAAGVFVLLELLLGNRLIPMIGASGAVMAVLMLYAMHFPRERIWIMMLIPIEIRWLVAFYVIVDLHPILLALGGSRVGDGVAHAAHIGGLLFGFLYRRFNWRLDSLLGRLRRPRLDRWFGSRRNIRLHEPTPPPEDDFDDQVDRILAKISQQGEASLSDREREILKSASQKYKRR